MTEFGPNGEVINAPARPYQGAPGQQKLVKRVPLAVFLCALTSCLLVGLSGALGMVVFETAVDSAGLSRRGFAGGMEMAFIISTFNWVLFFITIPASALALGLSIGRFPGRRITAPMPYYRWGAIWGAILVAGTTTIFGISLSLPGALGGLLGGLIIGVPSGIASAGLFLAIVRPREQLGRATTEVF